MALYPKAIKKLIAPGPNDPKIKARVVILHVAVSETASLYAYFNGPSGGVESHFYVRRDGTVEQYRDTAYQADANTDANDFAISIETQGMAAGQWTPEQLASIKALLLWCHEVHGIPLVKCPAWNGSGVGYHTQFRGSWDKRGASCPGPDRIKQFDNVLVPWMATGESEEDMPTAAEIADEILKRPVKDLAGNTVTVGAAVGVTLRNTGYIASLIKAQESAGDIAAEVVAALPPGQPATARDIAAEIIAQLSLKDPA